jgi:adenylate/nucleoside-diphosphate kinase
MAWEFKRPVAEAADEEEKPDRLIYYEQSYNFKKSRYYDRNPLNLFDVPRCREYPLIYRNRIYYFQSRTELEMVKMEPLKYLVNKTFPIDINIKPSVFVIGKSHSGKSSLCKLLE